MKHVRRQDTAPEVAVRRYLHAAGLRFRLHVRDLPGTPDIVLPKYKTVVFVHGCFWHGHDCKHGDRDARKAQALKKLGWHVETVWECQCSQAALLGRLCSRITKRARSAGK